MEGYIFTWTNFIKGWRPRYVNIEENMLFISHKKGDTKKKSIEIKPITNIIDDKKAKFSLRNINQKTIYFKAKTKEEKDNWLEELNKAIKSSKTIQNKISIEEKNILEKKEKETENPIQSNGEKNTNNSEVQIPENEKKSNSPNDLNPQKSAEKFSKCFYNYEELIEKEFRDSSMNNLDKVIYSFKNLQNLFFEFNNNTENFKEILTKEENKSKEILQIFDSFCNLKNEIKNKFDDCIKYFFEFKDIDTNNKYIQQDFLNFSKKEDSRSRINTQYFETPEDIKEIYEIQEQVKIKENSEKKDEKEKEELINLNLNNEEKVKEFIDYTDEEYENSFESYEECNDEKQIDDDEELKSIKSDLEKSQILESKENKSKFQKSISFIKDDFFDSRYNFNTRRSLPFPIKCSNSMVSDMLKSLTKEKVQLPINYNEPLSMLQKQCEKFMYANLLNKAANTEDPYLKLAYIAGFIVAEVNLNINRILKPFNPILGETFEYIDNNSKYRFFSEQVSHNPPISAFICESGNFVFYGDTRSKSKFSLFKGNMELNFLNKYNLLIKSSNDHFVYNKPDTFMKGLVFGTPHYDFKGKININEISKNKASAILEFFEEGKKQKNPGFFEGKIIDENEEIKYLIKGKWDSNLYITDKAGLNKIEIWQSSQEEFLSNSDFINNYLISSYSCNFNFLGENSEKKKSNRKSLENILPSTDSRFRKDQKLVEERKLEIAQEEKERLENLQRIRHKKFEEEKIKYSPNYFNEIFDEKSNEYIYLFNGEYWEDRKKGNFEKLHDIFDNKNSISDK